MFRPSRCICLFHSICLASQTQMLQTPVVEPIRRNRVLLGVVCLIYLLVRTGRMANQDAGLVALLALALTTFLSGVHADWRVAVVGVFLALIVIAVAMIEQFMWILLVLVVVAVMIGLFLWRTSRQEEDA